MIDWIFCRLKMPDYAQDILVTDGFNIAINRYANGIFKPIRLIRGKTADVIPIAWYPLNNVRLPEE